MNHPTSNASGEPTRDEPTRDEPTPDEPTPGAPSHGVRPDASHRRSASLPARLLAAADWFNDALSAQMAAAGWPLLSRSQSLVFVSIDDHGTRPAELARRLGITRQSMQELLKKLVEHDLITIDVDPGDGRATIVRLAPRAHLLGRDAAIINAGIEAQLAERIGRDVLDQLRDALDRDWGAPPAVAPPPGEVLAARPS
jgi:DNA-binding MarR family transcriptional regulator